MDWVNCGWFVKILDNSRFEEMEQAPPCEGLFLAFKAFDEFIHPLEQVVFGLVNFGMLT